MSRGVGMSRGKYVHGLGGYVNEGGVYVQGCVCIGVHTSRAWEPGPLPGNGTWDITGCGRQAGGRQPTGMLSCFMKFCKKHGRNNILLVSRCHNPSSCIFINFLDYETQLLILELHINIII